MKTGEQRRRSRRQSRVNYCAISLVRIANRFGSVSALPDRSPKLPHQLASISGQVATSTRALSPGHRAPALHATHQYRCFTLRPFLHFPSLLSIFLSLSSHYFIPFTLHCLLSPSLPLKDEYHQLCLSKCSTTQSV